MASFSTLVVAAGILVAATNAHSASINVVTDAKMQAGKLYRCWEPIDSTNPGAGYTLSEPIYPMCQYMPSASNFEEFHVNGAAETSDDYTNVHKIFADVMEMHAVLNLCIQEGFSFFGPNRAAQVSVRCMCKRDGCNIPKSFDSFMEFNKQVIPAVAH